MSMQTTLIVGASSQIGQALLDNFLRQGNRHVIAVSRHPLKPQLNRLNCSEFVIDAYTDEAISMLINKSLGEFKGLITEVFICNGYLHSDKVQPEKKLEDINTTSFLAVIEANTLVPTLWLKNLLPVVKGNEACKVVVFSARVGSISDNRLGGWYTYRASKAALNMIIKTMAVEFARRAKNVKLIAFHPGTTDTPLSKPFQKNVKPEKLFTPEFVAERLNTILRQVPVDGEASYIDWQGNTIPW